MYILVLIIIIMALRRRRRIEGLSGKVKISWKRPEKYINKEGDGIGEVEKDTKIQYYLKVTIIKNKKEKKEIQTENTSVNINIDEIHKVKTIEVKIIAKTEEEEMSSWEDANSKDKEAEIKLSQIKNVSIDII